jgi:superkiller protein 3
MSRRRRILIALIGGWLVLILLAAVLRPRPSAVIEPPLPADLDAADPSFARMVTQARNDVLEDPRAAARWSRLGNIYQANDQFDLAAHCYEEAIALSENDARTWYHLGLVRQQLGATPAAIDAVRRAAALAPGYAPAHWRAGLWLTDAGDFEQAEAALRRATEVDPADASGWLGLARLHLARGEYEPAIRHLERIAQAPGPGAAYAWRLLGAAYRRAGRTADAELALARAGAGEPQWFDPWQAELLAAHRVDVGYALEYAKSLSAQGRIDDAVRILQQLHRLHPARPDVLNNLGGALVQQGRLDDAIRSFQESLALAANDATTQFNLALALKQRADQSAAPAEAYAQALAHADRAVALQPAHAQAHGLRGSLLAARGDTLAAIEAYTAAEQADPRSPWWPYRAAEQHLLAGRAHEAIALLRPLTERAGSFAGAFYLLGRALTRVGATGEAERALRRAVELDPGNREYGRALRELIVPGGPSP